MFKKLIVFILISSIFSCTKENKYDVFPMNSGGKMITGNNILIEIPENSMLNGAFTISHIPTQDYSGYLFSSDKSRIFLHSDILFFHSTKPFSDKPLKVTITYAMCDPLNSCYQCSCALNDVQANPFQLSVNESNIRNSIEDSLNYIELPVFMIDSINKKLSFEITDLTKMYVIGRKL